MIESQSEAAQERLAKPDVHERWEIAYRSGENERFYEQAFDYITRVVNAPENSTFLDAGCGTCAHSVRLANRGFLVRAVDFSESALEKGRAYVKAKGLEDRIEIRREDVLAFSFEDMSFDYVLCWGVLMHIHDLERAISELTRVLKPEGILIISEGNMYSFQSLILRGLRRLLGKGKGAVKKTPAGIEHWSDSAATPLLTRQANIRWLVRRLKSKQFVVVKRVAGQFTEVYTRVSSGLLRGFIHSFNRLWFKYIKIPHFAFGNILIVQKEK